MRIDMRGLRDAAKEHRWDLVLLIVVTLVCGLLVGTVLPGRGAIARAVTNDSATPLAVPDPIHLSSTFASIVQAVEPAVVNISTTQVHRAPERPQLRSKMELTYIRDRQERKASVTIEARGQVFAGNSSTAGNSPSEQSSPVKFGLHVEALSPERARQLGIEGPRGVVVSEADPGSFAEDIGFQQGDVIVEVNQKGVESSGDLRRELGGLRAGGEVVFKVLRHDPDRGLLTMFLAGTAPA